MHGTGPVEPSWLFIETVYTLYSASCDFQEAKHTFQGSFFSHENVLNTKRKHLLPLFSQVYTQTPSFPGCQFPGCHCSKLKLL